MPITFSDRNKHRRDHKIHKRVAAALAAAVSTGPALLPLPIAHAVTAQPVPITGLLGETARVDLSVYFDSAALAGQESVTISGVNVSPLPYVAAYERVGNELRFYLNHPGMNSFTVTLGSPGASQQFDVRVMDPGADGKLDIGDMLGYMRSFPMAIESRDTVTKLLKNVDPAKAPTPRVLNRAPVAAAASKELTYASTSLVLPLSGVDGMFSDPDGDPLTFAVSPLTGMNGIVPSITSTGLVLFSGALTGAESASFTVTAKDNFAAASTVVQLRKPAAPVNQAPQTVGGVTYSVYASPGLTPAPLALSSRFTDPDGDALTYALATPADVSGLSAAISGSVLSFSGTMPATAASFGVTAQDGKGGVSPVFTFLLSPTPVTNQPPTVASSVYTLDTALGGVPLAVNLGANFSDPDGDPLTYSLLSAASSGGLSASISGGLLYFTGALASGGASFTVLASDGRGGTATASYTVTPTPVTNQAPQKLQAEVTGYYTAGASSLTNMFNLYQNFYDTDSGDMLTFSVNPPTSGSLSAYIASGSQLYVSGTPPVSGDAVFTVTATDKGSLTASALYKMRANHLPTVVHATYGLYYTKNTAIAETRVNLATNFSDADSDSLTYTLKTGDSTIPTGLTASIVGSELVYSGNIGAQSGSLVIEAADGKGGGTTAVYTLDYYGPKLVSTYTNPIQEEYSISRDGYTYLEFYEPLSKYVYDPSGGTLTYSINTDPAKTSSFLQNANAISLSYDNLEQQHYISVHTTVDDEQSRAQYPVAIDVTDTRGETITLQFQLKHEYTVPMVSEEEVGELYYNVKESTSVLYEVPVEYNFFDEDGDALTYTIDALNSTMYTAGITQVTTSSGLVTYLQLNKGPDYTADAATELTIRVTASDAAGGSAYADYIFTPNHAPEAKLASNLSVYQPLEGGYYPREYSLDFGNSFTDADPNADLTYSLYLLDSGAGWLSLGSDSTVLHFGTPSGGLTGSLLLTVTDDRGFSEYQTITFTPASEPASRIKDKSVVNGSQLTMKEIYRRYSGLSDETRFEVQPGSPLGGGERFAASITLDGKDLLLDTITAGYPTSGVVAVIGSDTNDQGIIDSFTYTSTYIYGTTYANPFTDTSVETLDSTVEVLLPSSGVAASAIVNGSGDLQLSVNPPETATGLFRIKSHYSDNEDATIYEVNYEVPYNGGPA